MFIHIHIHTNVHRMVCSWVQRQAAKLGNLKGLWHAAGLLDDHLLADMEREHLHLGAI